MSGIMPTKISVIIPTLNEAETISRLIQSLNGIPELEIIVNDGGSTDDTVEKIRHSGVVAVQSKPGRGVQLNAGVQAASGDILLFLHADSRLAVSAIAQIRQAVMRGAQWGCCQLKFDEDVRFFRILAKTSDWRARYLSISSDIPGIDLNILEQACAELRQHDLVLGSALDGGYYLIGLKSVAPFLFRDIDWGTGQVLEQTLQAARQHQLWTMLLPELQDIDRWQDLIAWEGPTEGSRGKPTLAWRYASYLLKRGEF